MKLALLLFALSQAAAPVRLTPAFMGKVLARLESTPAMARLAQQYRLNPIPIVLRPSQLSEHRLQDAAAMYNFDRTIDLNVDIFGAEPSVEEVAPTLGHELKHWQTDEKFGDAASLENELEAHHVQALHILQRVKLDPAYFDGRKGVRAEVDYDLAESWLAGPEEFADRIRGRYPKHESVFGDERERLSVLRSDLAEWEKRKLERDEDLAKLKEQQERLERLERGLVSERFGGGSNAQKLAQTVRDYPAPEAMDRIIGELQWSIKFWSDPALLGAAREHYAAFWKELSSMDRSAYSLPKRPSLIAKLGEWLKTLI